MLMQVPQKKKKEKKKKNNTINKISKLTSEVFFTSILAPKGWILFPEGTT